MGLPFVGYYFVLDDCIEGANVRIKENNYKRFGFFHFFASGFPKILYFCSRLSPERGKRSHFSSVGRATHS